MTERFVPRPTPETRTFWDKASQGELWLPRCDETGRYFFPPSAASPFTGGPVTWTRASGLGTLASYVINHRAAPGYEAAVPYVIALVRLNEGVMLTANILDAPADPVRLPIGLPLEVTFERRGDIGLPQFRPARDRAA